VYVELYVAKLRITYPHKTKKQLRKELSVKVEKQREIKKKIEPLQKELDELLNPGESQNSEEASSPKQSRKRMSKDPNFYQTKIDELKREHDSIDEVERNGWILLDFPSTFAQAKLLENALSGFVPK
jgi:adenylate kinase family enzyme